MFPLIKSKCKDTCRKHETTGLSVVCSKVRAVGLCFTTLLTIKVIQAGGRVRGSPLCFEEYFFVFADLWEVKYSSSDCQLKSYQGGGCAPEEGVCLVPLADRGTIGASALHTKCCLGELQMIICCSLCN